MDKISSECPECGGAVRFSLEDVARGRTVTCSKGHEVKLHDKGGGARSATKAYDNLMRSIDRLGRSGR